jgi:hypothetical protein
MKSTVFWDVTVCSPVEFHGYLRGSYCLLLQGGSVSEVRSEEEACGKQGRITWRYKQEVNAIITFML